MTQDEIIEMARQANFYHSEYAKSYAANIEDIEAFAKLVAERERDECALIADRMDACQDGEIGKTIRARSGATLRGES
jgi:hypothetical protein